VNENTRVCRAHPLKQGDVVGWLTIDVFDSRRCTCSCACGKKGIFRETNNLRNARDSAQVPKCKECQREERKNRNPGGGGVPGMRLGSGRAA
jgi:hypothetical protein